MSIFDFLENISKQGYDSVEDYLNQTGQNYEDLPTDCFQNNNEDE